MYICKEQFCTGCRTCEQICPLHAVSMKFNHEGFLFPVIDEDKCVKCNICRNACPHNIEKKYNFKCAYALKLKDEKRRMKSSSGGAFVAFAQYVLQQNGYVYGCAWKGNNQVHHIEISREAELEYLQGSKYVQSDTENTYTLVKKRLDGGQYVLYCGTPCQIAGLQSFLKKKYDKLYTIDFICHGVPSGLLFEKYLEHLENKKEGVIKRYNFREKEKYGWGLYPSYIIEKQGKKEKIYKENPKLDRYYSQFLEGNTYRECCYTCEYAKAERISDITLGDYWGIKQFHQSFYSQNGVSAVLINNLHGEELFVNVKDQVDYIETDIEFIKEQNLNLRTASQRRGLRDNIYQGIETNSNYITKKLKVSVINIMKAFVPGIIKDTVKNVLKIKK